MKTALIAQVVERILGKNEVMGSNPIGGFDLNPICSNKYGVIWRKKAIVFL